MVSVCIVKKVTSSFPCVGTMAAGHLQTQLEAATWTLLSGRILHLLCIKGRIQSETHVMGANKKVLFVIINVSAVWVTHPDCVSSREGDTAAFNKQNVP